jgi:hypothetical protein
MKTRAFQRLRRPLRSAPQQGRSSEKKVVALKAEDLVRAAGGMSRKVNEYEGQHR